MQKPITRSFVTDAVDSAKREVTAIISTQDPDRYQTVFLTSGCNADAFRRSPSVLWVHGKDPQRGERPIGRNVSLKADTSKKVPRLIAKTVFNTDEFSEQLFLDYKNGFLTAFSIRALPVAHSKPTPEEIRRNPSWANVDTVFRNYELIEYSAVGCAGNSECTTLSADETRGLKAMISRGYYVLPEARRQLDRKQPVDKAGKPLPSLDGAKTLGERLAEASKAVSDWEKEQAVKIQKLAKWVRENQG
jgi:hypothetical protein